MIRRWLAELREGARILRSRDFWRAFKAYWVDELPARMDEWTARQRDAQGMPLDRDLEHRRARRRARNED